MLDGNNEAEALCNIAEQSEERKATIAPGNSRTENEASYQDNIAEVTSVVDDRDNDHKHSEEAVELLEVENKAVEEIYKPIETFNRFSFFLEELWKPRPREGQKETLSRMKQTLKNL